ncbi:GerAB/ArcD/ProY family transporter [Clostridium magnum]|uniref:Spore germination protein B2 n=1 Tax=Clostridium magnum DSM 2767 TaxID=1121326 RepID=A0A161W1K7_9CLOT|nr:endospore germination permease [Clostridium magnum]KZL89060.1 spore germination protein B2 [Clostridium magnum DSM 2767]SHI30126.1 spore germination protein KB [Clostridium magnum DSM 2767]
MERISNYQLYVLTVLYQIGTTIIFGFASTAGRDAWIAVLISTIIGLLIMLLYTLIMRMNPGLTIVEWYPAQFGKWLGTPIAWVYALLSLYELGRGLGDFAYLVPLTLLPKTSIFIVLTIFVLVLVYAVFSGIEIIARLGELFLPLIFLLFFLEVILIFNSDVVHIHNLQPIAGKGWGTIWNSVWPLGISQSFGESIELAMIWPLVKQPEKIMKTTLLATITTGVFIALFDVISIVTLGEGIFKNSIYPFYTLIRQISIGDFIENLDAIEVLYFLSTLFFKMSIHLFAGVRAIQQLTLVTNGRIFVLPVAAIGLYLAMTMASNVSAHIEAGLKIIPYNLLIPLFLILPGILFIVTLIRQQLKN